MNQKDMQNNISFEIIKKLLTTYGDVKNFYISEISLKYSSKFFTGCMPNRKSLSCWISFVIEIIWYQFQEYFILLMIKYKKIIYFTALHFACQQDNIEIAKLFLSITNINVNIQTISTTQIF